MLPGAARLHQPHAAQQPKLMRHGRLAQPEDAREVADRHFGPRQRIQNPDARRVAQDLEGLSQGGDGALVEQIVLPLNI